MAATIRFIEDGVKVVGGHDQAVIGAVAAVRQTPANHIAEYIKDHHIGVFEQVVLLQQLHRLAGDVATASGAGRGATTFNARTPLKPVKTKSSGRSSSL